MNGIIIRQYEDIDKAIRRFSKLIDDGKTLSEMKEYEHFEKPSNVRHRNDQYVTRQRKLNKKLLEINNVSRKSK